MPRKPKQEKETITVIVNGDPVAVVLHPPSGIRKSWYAFWNGLVTSKSTGQRSLQDAIIAAESMVRSGGKRVVLADTVLSDEEFEEIQRRHFGRRTAELAKQQAKKSLDSCLEAIAAFKEITGLRPIALATPDDCANFQRVALMLPNMWRRLPLDQRRPMKEYTDDARARRRQSNAADALDDYPRYSPNTVVKWSRTLQGAFERANRNALKRKCVRGVIDEQKLLTSNPWNQFTWIEGKDRPIRQFDSDELLSFLAFLESTWGGISVGIVAAKVFVWSGCRKLEVASLTWTSLRIVGDEYHFRIIGKRNVERWFRVPVALYRELLEHKTSSPYVFSAYNEQLRRFHANNPNWLRIVGDEFTPKHFGRWFYQRVKDWAASNPKGDAFVHVFRKTVLQHARRGEDINRQVAKDAKVSESVMMTNYVKEEDEELRAGSNRTFHRILASLSPEVAQRYGHVEVVVDSLERQLQAATAAKNWPLAAELAARLAAEGQHD